jgi:hypothetical protein
MAKRLELTGQKFGRLTAVRDIAIIKGQGAQWLCRCDCGNEAKIIAKRLKSGHTRSCGCLHTEAVRRPRTHGGSQTNAYSSWQNMISRCTHPSYPSYEHYKARGITVCDRWKSFENFLADMGERPGGFREYSLERIDNDKGYEPGNCCWATWKEQAKNRTDNSGEKNPAAKLTNEQAAAIRSDPRRQHVIAAEYGVRQQQISRIKSGTRRRNG